MASLINKTLSDALCQQIAEEKFNANVYLYICGFLRNKGFNNLAKLFENQHAEEIEHSKMFFTLLTDLNSPVFIPQINEVDFPIESIKDIAKYYLEREIITTTNINELKKIAVQEDNPIVEEFLRIMVNLQRKEYEESLNFMSKAELFSDWVYVGLWDNTYGN